MKFNITRQPLALAILTLIVLACLAVANADATATAPATECLGGYITLFQNLYPVIAKLTAVIIIVATGMILGRISVRYNLFGSHTYIAIPVYGLIACVSPVNNNFLLQFFIALLFVLAIQNYIYGFRTGYGFGNLFRGALFLGIIPLLYPQSTAILLLMPIMIFVFKRTGREFVVATAGEILPIFTVCYIKWCNGGSFLSPIKQIGTVFGSGGNMDAINNTSIFLLAYFSLIVIFVVIAIILFSSNIYSIGFKSRSILIFNIIALPIIASSFLHFGASTHTIALMAAPISMIIPVFFLRVHTLIATSCYVVILVLCILNLCLY